MSERSEAEMTREAVEATGNLSNLSSDDRERITRLLGSKAVRSWSREQILRELGRIAAGG